MVLSDPQHFLSHIPKEHEDTVVEKCAHKETIKLAEHFPRFAIEKKLLKKTTFFGLVNFMIMIGLGMIILSLNWGDFADNLNVFAIVVLVSLWLVCFAYSTALFAESVFSSLCGESLVVTDHRLIRIISPIRFCRPYSESFWFNTLDYKWLQIREENSKLACYSIILQSPPAFETIETDNEISKFPSFHSFMELQPETDWKVSRDDRVGFIHLRATKETIMTIYQLITQYAAPLNISMGVHYCGIDIGRTIWNEEHPIALQGILSDTEWKDIDNQLQDIRTSPLLLLLPIISTMMIVIGTICLAVLINDVVLLLVIANSYPIVITLSSINYILYRYVFETNCYITKEKIDALVFELNCQYKESNLLFLNKGMTIEVKSLEDSDTNPMIHC